MSDGINNRNYKLDTNWHDGIISVLIDADGVNSNDNYITKNILKNKINEAAYLRNGHHIKLASLLTDHGGGFRTSNPVLMPNIYIYIYTGRWFYL